MSCDLYWADSLTSQDRIKYVFYETILSRFRVRGYVTNWAESPRW